MELNWAKIGWTTIGSNQHIRVMCWVDLVSQLDGPNQTGFGSDFNLTQGCILSYKRLKKPAPIRTPLGNFRQPQSLPLFGVFSATRINTKERAFLHSFFLQLFVQRASKRVIIIHPSIWHTQKNKRVLFFLFFSLLNLFDLLA